jgi:hypothetical protein
LDYSPVFPTLGLPEPLPHDATGYEILPVHVNCGDFSGVKLRKYAVFNARMAKLADLPAGRQAR